MIAKFVTRALSLFALVGVLAACGAGSDGEGSGEVRMRLTDAPADEASRLDVDFGEMQLVPSEDAEGGIEVVADAEGSLNVLDYRNGGFFELGETTVPAGSYTQLRLIVDDASLTFGEGESAVTEAVTVPSGAQTGLKIALEPALEVTADGSHEVRLDFDAGRAVVETGAGEYLLRPTALRAVTEHGEIEGSVVDAGTGEALPEGTTVTVEVLHDGSVVTSTTTDADGSFAFVTLLEGTFDLEVSADGYATATRTDVEVSADGTVTLDPIELTPEVATSAR